MPNGIHPWKREQLTGKHELQVDLSSNDSLHGHDVLQPLRPRVAATVVHDGELMQQDEDDDDAFQGMKQGQQKILTDSAVNPSVSSIGHVGC